FNSQTKQGYFASNREQSKGYDDIYGFKEIPCEASILGVISNKNTQEPLVGAEVLLTDQNNKVLERVSTTLEGRFIFKETPCSKSYLIRVSKEGFLIDEKTIEISDARGHVFNVDFYLESKAIKSGDDLTEVLNLRPIYFDYNVSTIRPDAEIELQKVIAVLKQFPEMRLEVNSHTDSRGRASYNLKLSKNRNKAIITYLQEQGKIDPTRLNGTGYGETRLVNNCLKSRDCNEIEHQKNRRSEFIVLKN
ncbi:MAG: OmpA family protein, partial [Flavobacteriaceae bacterium]|nr:OmpA family protein [Flavobacteriaceae bacterium]